jgi:hypothetical protein
LDHVIDPRDTDGAQQTSDGGRGQADKQCNQLHDREVDSEVQTDRLQRDYDREKNERQRAQQDGKADLICGPLPLRRLDQTNHAIDE